jgi:ABC-type uncharacterized transport system substrate-binding protein
MLVRNKVDVIVTAGGAVLAAKQATSDIPIVFAIATDPVGGGLVASLARPGGNVTGLSLQFTDTAGKRIELLREVVPSLQRLAVMGNANYPSAVVELREVQTIGRTVGLEVLISEIRRAEEIAPAVEAIKGRADGLYVAADPLATTNRMRISALATGARLPTMTAAREYAEAGALISYGASYSDLHRRAADLVDKILRGTKPADIPVEQPTKFGGLMAYDSDRAGMYRQVGAYTGQILKGARPADLPVLQSTKFELVINMQTARALGLEVPNSLQLLADEVIE